MDGQAPVNCSLENSESLLEFPIPFRGGLEVWVRMVRSADGRALLMATRVL